MSSAPAESSPPRERISRRRVRLGGQEGQSLIIVVIAMFVVLGISAVAVDLAQWYQKHHQAQVAADAAALGVADCMGRGACTSTDVGTSTGMTYASTNGVPATSVSINTNSYNVTVTTATAAPNTFAGLFSVHASVSARAVANWDSGSTPYSFFAGNTSCGAGTGIYFAGNGGGTTSVPGVHSNGLVVVNANSGSVSITGSITDNSTGTGPVCSGTSTSSKNVDLASSGDAGGNPNGTLNWPETYTAPTCNASNTSTYWTTNAVSGHQITSGGVYCVTTAFSGTCSASVSGTAGTIYLDTSIQGIELYAPCISIGSGASGSTAITGSTPFEYPLAYATGTQNVTAPSGNGNGGNSGAANPSIFVGDANQGNGGGITLTGALYAPGTCTTDANFPVDSPTCSGTINGGTVEISGNNQLTAFIEAENIWVDKNNFKQFNGNGPTNPFGGTELTQ